MVDTAAVVNALTERISDELLVSTAQLMLRISAVTRMEAEMRAGAHVVHHIPGRVRLRVPAKRHDRRFFSEVKAQLEQVPQVRAVAVNHTSASVLVKYEGEILDLLLAASQVGLEAMMEIEPDLPPLVPVADRLLGRLGDLDERIVRATGGGADGRSVVLIALLLAAGVQLLRGQIVGPAVPLLWYATRALGGILPGAKSADG